SGNESMNDQHNMGRRSFCRSVLARGGAALVAAGYLGGCTPRAAAGDGGKELGAGADLGDRRVFPADNPWNQDVSEMEADPASRKILASIGLDKPLHPDFGTVYNGAPLGIPYVVVSGDQKKVPVRFEYKDESDPGPYPIPDNAPVEGGPKS